VFIWSVDSKENLQICCHQVASFKAKMHQIRFGSTSKGREEKEVGERTGGRNHIIKWREREERERGGKEKGKG